MNLEVKEKWIAALRSGDYQRGEGFLRRDESYCCLGVLCDLAVKDGVILEPKLGVDKFTYYYAGIYTHLPQAVIAWAGEDVMYKQYKLSTMNDDGASFAEIADFIERWFVHDKDES